jgi:CDP-paratose 2-epimerase
MSEAILDGRPILITGGAGFVGSRLASQLAQQLPGQKIIAMDNLKRRGGFLNLSHLDQHGIEFLHGDVRCPDDLIQLPDFCLLIDCSAEASVHAAKLNVNYVLNTNLIGTMHLFEAARRQSAAFLLLSTSRVYPIEAINALPYTESATRFEWRTDEGSGISPHGISESFPLDGSRSFYGASKLCCEMLMAEYVAELGQRCLTNRCGILAGPGQMGVASQGIVAFWVLNHVWKRAMRYIGFEGTGKQVRDVLHVDDLADLIVRQIQQPQVWNGSVYNVGGGVANSTSLLELTQLCEQITDNRVPIASVPTTSDVDVRIFITDSRQAAHQFDWSPRRDLSHIVRDIHQWVIENESDLASQL